MPGVPGRPGACATCKTRKKGCDRKAPSCGQCIKSALVCGGYIREYTFVNAERTRYPPKAIYTGSGARARRQHHEAGNNTSTDVTLHDSLAISARDSNLVGLYWESFLPNGRGITLKNSSLSAGGWITFLGNLHQAEPALKYAVHAISYTMLGVRDSNEQLRVKGLQTYTLSLKELNTALQTPKRATSDGLLAAVRVMGSYQVLFGRDAKEFDHGAKTAHVDGWNSHTDGEQALIELRGPTGFQTPAGHQLFADGLMNAITNCSARRKRTIFAHSRWRTEPWAGRSRTLKDTLLDIVIDIPGYMEDFDAISTITDPQMRLQQRSELLRRCYKTDRYRLDWETIAATKIQRFDCSVTGLPVPNLVKDEDLSVLHLSCFYWAMCLQLHQLIKSLHDMNACGADSQLSNTVPAFPSRIDPDKYAEKIVHCVHLHFAPEAGGLGANLGIMPLAVAWFYLDRIHTKSDHQKSMFNLINSLLANRSLDLYVTKFLGSLRYIAVRPSVQDRGMYELTD